MINGARKGTPSRERLVLEKGEKAVLALQFGLLFVVVAVIGNLLPGQVSQNPSFTGVYWGQPLSGNEIPMGGTLQAKTNASSIFAYFQLPSSTTVSSATAGRLCSDATMKVGESKSYDTVLFGYDQNRSASYFIISPAGQPNGWSCTYSIQITGSLGGVTKWTGTVVLKQ